MGGLPKCPCGCDTLPTHSTCPHTHVQSHPTTRPCVKLVTLPHPALSCLNAGAHAVHPAGKALPHCPFSQLKPSCPLLVSQSRAAASRKVGPECDARGSLAVDAVPSPPLPPSARGTRSPSRSPARHCSVCPAACCSPPWGPTPQHGGREEPAGSQMSVSQPRERVR